MKLNIALICAAAAMATPRSAIAAPIVYTFDGSITLLNVLSSDPASRDIDVWLPGLHEGAAFSGTFMFDPVDQSADLQVRVSTYSFEAQAFSTSVVHDSQFVIGDHQMTGDFVDFWSSAPGLTAPTPTLFLPDDIHLSFWDTTGSSLSGAVLGGTSLDHFPFELLTFDGNGYLPRSSATIDWQGNIISFRQVPEPTTLALLCSAAIGLGWPIRRRSARSARLN
ncbi:MAG TPA: PEP-CTERM sorting domain-containing protein [Vicinamibacterales bacterium]|jgi:hypothetical protein